MREPTEHCENEPRIFMWPVVLSCLPSETTPEFWRELCMVPAEPAREELGVRNSGE